MFKFIVLLYLIYTLTAYTSSALEHTTDAEARGTLDTHRTLTKRSKHEERDDADYDARIFRYATVQGAAGRQGVRTRGWHRSLHNASHDESLGAEMLGDANAVLPLITVLVAHRPKSLPLASLARMILMQQSYKHTELIVAAHSSASDCKKSGANSPQDERIQALPAGVRRRLKVVCVAPTHEDLESGRTGVSLARRLHACADHITRQNVAHGGAHLFALWSDDIAYGPQRLNAQMLQLLGSGADCNAPQLAQILDTSGAKPSLYVAKQESRVPAEPRSLMCYTRVINTHYGVGFSREHEAKGSVRALGSFATEGDPFDSEVAYSFLDRAVGAGASFAVTDRNVEVVFAKRQHDWNHYSAVLRSPQTIFEHLPQSRIKDWMKVIV